MTAYDFSLISDNDLCESISRLETAGLRIAAKAAIKEAAKRGVLEAIDLSTPVDQALDVQDFAGFAAVINLSRYQQRKAGKAAFVKLLAQLVTRAPIIRYPYGIGAIEVAAYARRRG
jgi:hypothetical protein